MDGLEATNLKQNKNTSLKKYYNSVYVKGEKKVYTDTGNSEVYETLKQLNWKNKKVLDVGCGTGLFSYLVAKKGAKVLGIDFSKEAISIAQKKYSNENLLYKNIDIKNLKKDKFDIIVSLGSLEHMDEPLEILKIFKKNLEPKGKIIITSPNWTNPRGYMLIILYFLFNAPITLADLHYLTPIDFKNWGKKLNMKLKWNTFDNSWGNGDILIKDFKRRIPNILSDMKIDVERKKINDLLKWIKKNISEFDNELPHSGATGIYIYSKK